MSTIASFYVAPRSVLSRLTEAGMPAHEVLAEQSTRIPDEFAWSGSIMISLLFYLDDNGIDVLSGLPEASERAFDGSAWAFGREHRGLAPQLDRVAKEIPAVAQAVLADVSDLDLDDPELAVESGLETLRYEIGHLADDEVLVLLID